MCLAEDFVPGGSRRDVDEGWLGSIGIGHLALGLHGSEHWLGANLGTIVEGDDDCALLFPVGASGDDCDAGGAVAIGGVSLFLECAVEVRVGGVPSTIYVDGVAGGKGTSRLELALVGG